MERLPVAVPWNLSCYAAANGFHPLYRALFEDNALFAFNAIDDVALARRLQDSRPFYRGLLARRAHRMAEVPQFLRQTTLGRGFIENLSPSNIALSAELPGVLELHHTSPLTTGSRPFVLHCESFLPIFQPFWSQGMGQLRNVTEVRDLYGRLFRSDTCLGILSHIPLTLDQISRFFREAAIDAKLHVSRIGLGQSMLTGFARPRAGLGPAPVFLFTSSAHQSPRTFALRGGFAALLFAERLLKSGRDGQFLFRSKRPASNELTAAGLDARFFESLEGKHVFWLERFLPEHEQLRLFTTADFLLLPSVNLHSLTLMQALAAGAIPVVTDTQGVENYVSDGETGIVLRGVQKAVWRGDPETGIPVDDHDARSGLDVDLAKQAVQRVNELLATPGAVEAMRHRMRMAAERRYSGMAFRDEMAESIHKLWRDAPRSLREEATAQRRWPLAEEGALRADRWDKLFESPPQPMLVLNTGGARVYSCKGIYFFVRGDLSLSFDELSPLFLREHGRIGPIQIGERLDEFAGFLFSTYGSAGPLTARWRYWRFRFQEGTKALLWPYKRLYRTARWVYRAAANLRRRLARLSS